MTHNKISKGLVRNQQVGRFREVVEKTDNKTVRRKKQCLVSQPRQAGIGRYNNLCTIPGI